VHPHDDWASKPLQSRSTVQTCEMFAQQKQSTPGVHVLSFVAPQSSSVSHLSPVVKLFGAGYIGAPPHVLSVCITASSITLIQVSHLFVVFMYMT